MRVHALPPARFLPARAPSGFIEATQSSEATLVRNSFASCRPGDPPQEKLASGLPPPSGCAEGYHARQDRNLLFTS